ncbi:MAG: hypothetical protein [Bacteriophage sp.]|nr:MAG: hypothetical protein [Bacteriophage sp.]
MHTVKKGFKRMANMYEEKQEQRRQRLLEKAAAARKKSDEILDDAHERHQVLLGSGGQPILYDHYSAKKHLNDQRQLNNSFRRSVKELEKAEYYEEKAKSVGTGGISSDDPEAIAKLEEKIAALTAEKGKTPAEYAEIRRLKKRVERLKQFETLETKRFPSVGYGFEIEQNAEEKRIKFLFAEKPSSDITSLLKKRGFHYSPKKNEWMRKWTNNAISAATELRSKIKKIIDDKKTSRANALSNQDAAE